MRIERGGQGVEHGGELILAVFEVGCGVFVGRRFPCLAELADEEVV